MEKLKSSRLQELGDLVNSEEHEHLETDDTQPPYLLFLVILAVVLVATLCTIIYFGLGNQTVSVTLGTHFQKR